MESIETITITNPANPILIWWVIAQPLLLLLSFLVGRLTRFLLRGRVAVSDAAATLIALVGLWLGIGLAGPLVALVVLAFPSILAGACTGVEAAPHEAVDGARACGMTPLQVLARVQVPLGAPQLLGGLRSASLQVISTATLASYTGAGGLGRLMFLGLKTQDYVMMLASALLVIALALASEAVFALIQWGVTPPGARQHRKESA